MSQQLEAATVVPLDAETAFALAHSVGDIRTGWDDTLVKRMLVRGAREPGADAVVFERARDGRRMLLRTETWFPPQLSAARMIKGPAWLADYGEGIHVTALDDGGDRTGRHTSGGHRSDGTGTGSDGPGTGSDGPGAPRTRVVFKITYALPRTLLPGVSERALRGQLQRGLDARAAGFSAAATDSVLVDRIRRGEVSPNSTHR